MVLRINYDTMNEKDNISRKEEDYGKVFLQKSKNLYMFVVVGL